MPEGNLRWPQFPEGVHVRTCQYCGHAQVMKDPAILKGEAWRDAKCRRCKSEAMDYGSTNNRRSEDDDA
jgi:hypothetical protein